MSAITRIVRSAAMLGILVSSVAIAQTANSAEAVDGRWDASLTSRGEVIPFRLDIAGSGPTLKGIFFDGKRPNDGTSSATFEDNKLVLRLDQYETIITATLQDGKLVGNVTLTSDLFSKKAAPKTADAGASTSEADRLKKIEFQGNPFAISAFQAVRHVDTPEVAQADVPKINGSWIIPLSRPSAKGENAFRFIVEQDGAYVEASILRVDGDTGAYSGTYKDGKWVLSHYDGGRPGVIEVSVAKDGSLEIVQEGGLANREGSKPAAGGDVAGVKTSGRYDYKLIAYRPDVEQAKGLPQPDDYATHTGIRNPNEVFKFKFPDDQGRLVSNEDARFKGKVVIAMVTGTWCPNCHDEAQYLVQLYKKYHDKGLEIVALDFEEPSQQKTLTREKAFIKHYGVQYPYLIAGNVPEVWEKVPQFINLNSWPTIIFVGRDGKVKATHTGFASPASGEFYSQLKEEFESTVEKLLSQKASQDVADSNAVSANAGQ
jgi:thiol-disulfide isomerase/thioredoxin